MVDVLSTAEGHRGQRGRPPPDPPAEGKGLYFGPAASRPGGVPPWHTRPRRARGLRWPPRQPAPPLHASPQAEPPPVRAPAAGPGATGSNRPRRGRGRGPARPRRLPPRWRPAAAGAAGSLRLGRRPPGPAHRRRWLVFPGRPAAAARPGTGMLRDAAGRGRYPACAPLPHPAPFPARRPAPGAALLPAAVNCCQLISAACLAMSGQTPATPPPRPPHSPAARVPRCRVVELLSLLVLRCARPLGEAPKKQHPTPPPKKRKKNPGSQAVNKAS